MELCEAATFENVVQQFTLEEITSHLKGLTLRINHLNNEVTTLAFNNYRTYADAGRATEQCKTMFSDVHDNVKRVKESLPEVSASIKEYSDGIKEFHKEYNNVSAVINHDNLLWKIMDMSKMFNECIRLNEYEAAFALTDFAVNLKCSRLYYQPLIKKPVDYVIDARHSLLDELFNKFTGPLDLSTSIQIINNIRKIPYISNTQLRVSILQYRNLFLDSQITKTMSKKEYIYKIIDIFRDCMYDTIILYLAIFPETETSHHRKSVIRSSSLDPKWERWTESSNSNHLRAWGHKNLEQLFELIRSATNVNYEALREKLMSFSSSFGRMGLDFRVYILEELQIIQTKMLKEKFGTALQKLISKKSIHLIDSEIVEMARLGLVQSSEVEEDASLPLDMIAWDDLIVYANEVITVLNDSRHTISVNQLNDLFDCLDNSFTALLLWIDGFLEASADVDSITAKRASQIVIESFIPFIQKYFTTNFSQFLRRKICDADEIEYNEPMKFKTDCAAYEIIATKESESEA
uniref:Conserved oligomeric Golgi complex subunit 8 n=1 Tax=Panagrolaimus sp. PS1159 TaxID=55785 RepID=A0AC35F816_9BILA